MSTKTIASVLIGSLCTLALACSSSDGDGGGDGGAAGQTVQPAAMVKLPAGFSIDSTEVTRAQYAAWLDSNPSTNGQTAVCAWNADYTPVCEWPPGDKPNHPVVCVDWCDAYAYCDGVGKRLCGKIGGGANADGDFDDASKSQWFYACTADGQNAYPYGSSYEATACNTAVDQVPEPVASFPGCTSSAPGFEGVYDLSGNVAEFEDSCTDQVGEDDYCRLRGGFRMKVAGDAACAEGRVTWRRDRVSVVGFRCCRD